MQRATSRRLCIALALCLALIGDAAAQQSRTVIGFGNEDLAAGAAALAAGNAGEGVRLTLRGLGYATSRRDRIAAMANLCAGYVLLEEPARAVGWCDQALELNDAHWRALNNRAVAFIHLGEFEDAERDLQKAEALAPEARTVRRVRAMLLDATDPVAATIIVDDRRREPPHDEQ